MLHHAVREVVFVILKSLAVFAPFVGEVVENCAHGSYLLFALSTALFNRCSSGQPLFQRI